MAALGEAEMLHWANGCKGRQSQLIDALL